MIVSAYICSDPHFWHPNIMKHCARVSFMTERDREQYNAAQGDPVLMHRFRPSEASVRNMNAGLVANINARVHSQDILWCLGDWAMFPRDKKEYDNYYYACREIRDQINCQCINFIWGNHDGKRHQRQIGNLFNNCYDQTEERFGAAKVTFNHYPLISWNGQHHGTVEAPNVCCYGHVHNKDKIPKTLVRPEIWAALDCGFDSNNYQVWLLQEVLDYLKPQLAALVELKVQRGELDPFRGRSL